MTTPKAQPLEALAHQAGTLLHEHSLTRIFKVLIAVDKQARSEGFAAGIEKAAKALDDAEWSGNASKLVRALTEDSTDG